jgi:hypothetical protein
MQRRTTPAPRSRRPRRTSGRAEVREDRNEAMRRPHGDETRQVRGYALWRPVKKGGGLYARPGRREPICTAQQRSIPTTRKKAQSA